MNPRLVVNRPGRYEHGWSGKTINGTFTGGGWLG
jgi:hypothetical protein